MVSKTSPEIPPARQAAGTTRAVWEGGASCIWDAPFLTNLPNTVPPGVIAQPHFMRWQVEKDFDEIKNY